MLNSVYIINSVDRQDEEPVVHRMESVSFYRADWLSVTLIVVVGFLNILNTFCYEGM